MPLTLQTISLDPGNDEILAQVGRILGPKAVAKQEDRIKKAVNKLGIMALQAYQSKVPIDTGFLRNNAIQIQFAQGKGVVAKVYVVDAIHPGAARTQSSIIAEVLDNGLSQRGNDLIRSANSYSVEPYTSISAGNPTRGWIEEGRRAFQQSRSMLNV